MIVRIFKTKALARFTKREAIRDEDLVAAIETARRGLIDADLGGGLIKQRVARPGQGKRGGFRMLIGFRSDRAFCSGSPRTNATTLMTNN
jgi:hypothetical protein